MTAELLAWLTQPGPEILQAMLHIVEADLLFSSNVPSGVTLLSKSEWEATQQIQAEPQSRTSEHSGLPEESSSIEHRNSDESPSTNSSEQDDEPHLASDVNNPPRQLQIFRMMNAKSLTIHMKALSQITQTSTMQKH